jgi:hypothetical protein
VILDFLLRDPDTLYLSAYRLSLAAIVVGSPIILSFFDYNPPRYYVPIVPAAILLVGEWLQTRSRLPKILTKRLTAFDVVILITLGGSLVMLGMATAGYWYAVATEKLFVFRYPDVYEYPIILEVFWAAVLIVAAVIYVTGRNFQQKTITMLIYAGIGLHVTSGFYFQWLSLKHPTFQARNIELQLADILQSDESIGGDWAPMLTSSSRRRSHYINSRFNRPDTDHFVKPAYYLDAGTYDDKIIFNVLQQDHRVSIGDAKVLGTYFFQQVKLYPLSYNE